MTPLFLGSPKEFTLIHPLCDTFLKDIYLGVRGTPFCHESERQKLAQNEVIWANMF